MRPITAIACELQDCVVQMLHQRGAGTVPALMRLSGGQLLLRAKIASMRAVRSFLRRCGEVSTADSGDKAHIFGTAQQILIEELVFDAEARNTAEAILIPHRWARLMAACDAAYIKGWLIHHRPDLALILQTNMWNEDRTTLRELHEQILEIMDVEGVTIEQRECCSLYQLVGMASRLSLRELSLDLILCSEHMARSASDFEIKNLIVGALQQLVSEDMSKLSPVELSHVAVKEAMRAWLTEQGLSKADDATVREAVEKRVMHMMERDKEGEAARRQRSSRLAQMSDERVLAIAHELSLASLLRTLGVHIPQNASTQHVKQVAVRVAAEWHRASSNLLSHRKGAEQKLSREVLSCRAATLGVLLSEAACACLLDAANVPVEGGQLLGTAATTIEAWPPKEDTAPSARRKMARQPFATTPGQVARRLPMALLRRWVTQRLGAMSDRDIMSAVLMHLSKCTVMTQEEIRAKHEHELALLVMQNEMQPTQHAPRQRKRTRMPPGMRAPKQGARSPPPNSSLPPQPSRAASLPRMHSPAERKIASHLRSQTIRAKMRQRSPHLPAVPSVGRHASRTMSPQRKPQLSPRHLKANLASAREALPELFNRGKTYAYPGTVPPAASQWTQQYEESNPAEESQHLEENKRSEENKPTEGTMPDLGNRSSFQELSQSEDGWHQTTAGKAGFSSTRGFQYLGNRADPAVLDEAQSSNWLLDGFRIDKVLGSHFTDHMQRYRPLSSLVLDSKRKNRQIV